MLDAPLREPSTTRTPPPCSAPPCPRRAAQPRVPLPRSGRRGQARRWRARSRRRCWPRAPPSPTRSAARVERGVAPRPDLGHARAAPHELLVGDIDEAVVGAAARTPFEARRRVFVIERADTMNDQAANRMLKTLEEPPPFAHLILLTDRPGEVLPDDRVALPARPLRRAERRRDRRPPGPQGVEPADGAAARASRWATASARARLALGDGPKLRARAEALRARRLHGDLAERPWLTILARPRRSATRRRPTSRRARTRSSSSCPSASASAPSARAPRRPGAPPAARAPAPWTRRSQLVGLWFRDVGGVADGASEVVHAVDRLDALRADAEGRRPHALRAPSNSSTRRARC